MWQGCEGVPAFLIGKNKIYTKSTSERILPGNGIRILIRLS